MSYFWLTAVVLFAIVEAATMGINFIWFSVGSLAAMICAMLGGGGHAAAAGCTVEAEWPEAKRQILDSIRANTPDFEE